MVVDESGSTPKATHLIIYLWLVLQSLPKDYHQMVVDETNNKPVITYLRLTLQNLPADYHLWVVDESGNTPVTTYL